MGRLLTDISKEMAGAVAKAGSGVVKIEARRRLPASGIIWSSDGVFVTAHHVVERDEGITIGLPNGRTAPATLVGRDPTTDLAVVRAQVTEIDAPEFAEPDSLSVGHLVFGLGRPGQTVMATLGIVSALGKTWRTPAGGLVDRYLQTDVVMYPGFSGGPLVDSEGRVLGLNTSALVRGVTLTVPVPTLRRVVESLLTHGRVRRGYLGVGAQPVRLPDALTTELGQETGLLLASVEQDTPAARAGLMLGDTIVSMGAQPVRHLDDLLGLLNDERSGPTVPVQIVRGGQLQELAVTIGERS